jgi:FKBP-type peptidyl-prolyl cis-trans isomerase
MEGGDYIELTKDGGLKKKILKEGNGDQPKDLTKVKVNYVGKFEDGKVFDQSEDGFTFKLGAGEVIKGWDLGVASMKKGEKAELVCRHDYAYGEQGYPGVIPKKATLIFTVELL